MKIKIEDGNFVVDIYDFFENLVEQIENREDPETYQDMLDELFEKLQWYHPVYRKLISAIRREYVSSNMNGDIFRLLRDFFLMPSDYSWKGKEDEVIQQMAHVLKELFEENAKLRAENRILMGAPHRFYQWAKDSADYNDEQAYSIYSKILGFQHGEGENNEISFFDLGRKMSDGLDKDKLEDFIKNWVSRMYELLEEEVDFK